MKTEFLAVYDYETGGAWVYPLADSAAQVHERFPELRVGRGVPRCRQAGCEPPIRHATLRIHLNDRPTR
jgi:hypothetical protein